MSDDPKPIDDLFDTPPELEAKFVRTGELDDTPLSRRIDRLSEDVRTGFELLNERLMPMLERLEAKLDDVEIRLTRVEKNALAADRRLTAIEQSLGIAQRKQAKRKK